MSERTRYGSTAVSIAVVTILAACAAGQPSVVEKLDELTAVTLTHNRTPIIMSPDTPFDRAMARDYLQLGAIEVNRMGTLKYYFWLGISDLDYMASADGQPEGFESIVLVVDGEEFTLNVRGWTEAAIGASEAVYKKLYATSMEAYYEVTLDQVRLLAEADEMKLRTSGSVPKEFVSWYRQTTARGELADFVRTVLQ